MSRQVGNLVIDLVAKTASFHNEMTRSARRFERTLGGMQRTAQRVTRLIGTAFAGMGVTMGVREILEKTKIQEQAMAQLEAGVRSTGGAAGRSAAQLAEFAGELQTLTTYGDEAIMPMQAILLTFTKIGGSVMDDATRAVLDMSARLGTDLKSAAIQVGKALNDPILGVTSLSRAGVQFSQAQRDVIKSLVQTGQTAEAQRLILRELETQFSGSAVAARQTLGGAITALGNIIGDQLELKKNLTEPLREFIELAISNFEQVKKTFLAMVAAIAGAALPVALAKIAAGFRAIAIAVKEMTVAMARNPLTLLATVASMAAAELILFRDETVKVGAATARLGDICAEVWGRIKAIIGETWAAVPEQVRGASGAITGFFAQVLIGAKNTANLLLNILQTIPNAAAVAAVLIYQNFKRAFENISTLAASFGAGIKEAFTFDFSFAAFRADLAKNFEGVKTDAADAAAFLRDQFNVDHFAFLEAGVGAAIRDAGEFYQAQIDEIMRGAQERTQARESAEGAAGPAAAVMPPLDFSELETETTGAAALGGAASAAEQAAQRIETVYADLSQSHQDYTRRKALASMDATEREIAQIRWAADAEIMALAERTAKGLTEAQAGAAQRVEAERRAAQAIIAIHEQAEAEIARVKRERRGELMQGLRAAQEEAEGAMARGSAAAADREIEQARRTAENRIAYWRKMTESILRQTESSAGQRARIEQQLAETVAAIHAQAEQEIAAAARRRNEEMMLQFGSLAEGAAVYMGRLREALYTVGQAGYEMAGRVHQAMEYAFSDAIFAGLTGQFENLKTVLQNFALGIVRAFADLAARMFAQKVMMLAMGKTLGAAALAATVVEAGGAAAAWAPAAAMASLATLGANAAPASAAITSTTALATGMAFVPGLAEGGIVTRPTLIQAGEPGTGGEAVIPFNARGLRILTEAMRPLVEAGNLEGREQKLSEPGWPGLAGWPGYTAPAASMIVNDYRTAQTDAPSTIINDYRTVQAVAERAQRVPAMAEGGIVTQPTVISAGERSTGGEAVIPFNTHGIGALSKAIDKSGGARAVDRSIHLHNPTFWNQEEFQRTIKELSVRAFLDDYMDAGQTRVIIEEGI